MSLPEHGLVKAVWTEPDCAEMGWHDATIWAYSLQKADTDDTFGGSPGPTDRLLLDLDYICRWVEPSVPGGHYTFWVAPATLCFLNVTALQVSHSAQAEDVAEDMEIADLHRKGSEWHIEGHTFDIRLHADSFCQVFRAVPKHRPGQRMSLAERGGYSFGEQPADL